MSKNFFFLIFEDFCPALVVIFQHPQLLLPSYIPSSFPIADSALAARRARQIMAIGCRGDVEGEAGDGEGGRFKQCGILYSPSASVSSAQHTFSNKPVGFSSARIFRVGFLRIYPPTISQRFIMSLSAVGSKKREQWGSWENEATGWLRMKGRFATVAA